MMSFDTFDCSTCGDYFSISYGGKSNYWFQFTCKEYSISYGSDSSHIIIDNTNTAAVEPIQIPIFDFDFSDRAKLYEKIKTYLIFV